MTSFVACHCQCRSDLDLDESRVESLFRHTRTDRQTVHAVMSVIWFSLLFNALCCQSPHLVLIGLYAKSVNSTQSLLDGRKALSSRGASLVNQNQLEGVKTNSLRVNRGEDMKGNSSSATGSVCQSSDRRWLQYRARK